MGNKQMKPSLEIEFRQQDWEPGFAGYIDNGQPNGKAFCFLNVGSLLCAIAKGDLPAADLPYMIAESMMHEIIHALEAWAGVEFSEERVERLLEKYRAQVQHEGVVWKYDPSSLDKAPVCTECGEPLTGRCSTCSYDIHDHEDR